ncbi:hypothetical protein LSTR_LSTR010777 [Laodelphax striatellus]|uniref:BHLH domain-containing protein n=1 Tax=Laodelphax striatellus TaxID=195883 RepID=A0A482XCJ9_LAOST|nr:hypothetical protein LSTR_LSTR010777 [Laodelphax striatellus]
MFHTELERERRSELRQLYGQLHDAIWETACTDRLPDLVALGHAINSKTKICTIQHATFAIKALEKENVVLEAMRTVLKHENQRLKATLRQLQPKAKPEAKPEVKLEAKPELKPEENDDDYDDSGYVVNVKEEEKKNVSRGKKGERRKGKRKAKGW